MSIFDNEILIFDGAVGTELYGRGFYINRPFEELNLSAIDDVVAVHSSYIEAGAQVITTNTFSIPTQNLSKYDIEKQQETLIEAGLRAANLARNKHPSKQVKIAFSIGPTGQLIEPLGPLGKDEVEKEYAQIAEAALKSKQGFDFYILETFTSLDELIYAARGITRVDSQHPILASMSVAGATTEKQLADFAKKMEGVGVAALGLNCSEGPSQLLTTLKKLRALTRLPIAIQPNAGIPQQINGRYFYMTSPDYLAKFAKRYVEAGAQAVGGCCGTGPDHILAIAQALKMSKAKDLGTRISIEAQNERLGRHAAAFESPAFLDRTTSRVAQKLRSGKKLLSIEVSPPKGTQLEKFIEGLSLISGAGIDFVNVPDNPRANTRISSLHLAAALQNRPGLNLNIVPHFTTRDRNLIALQSDLLGAYVNGVHDVLLVTGDPPKLGNNKEATGVYDIDSIGLSYLVHCLNQGITPAGEGLGSQTGFGIGVASNPTAVNLDLELRRWRYKCESGADFAVTQPIFDPETFLRWLEKLGSQYLRPHLVGIWPFVSLRNAEFMANEVPGVKVPTWALDEMAKAGNDKVEATKRGQDIALRVMRALENSCQGFCISAPLGRVEVALGLVESF